MITGLWKDHPHTDVISLHPVYIEPLVMIEAWDMKNPEPETNKTFKYLVRYHALSKSGPAAVMYSMGF